MARRELPPLDLAALLPSWPLALRRDEAIVRLMAETGMRAGELVGLTVPDVDLA